MSKPLHPLLHYPAVIITTATGTQTRFRKPADYRLLPVKYHHRDTSGFDRVFLLLKILTAKYETNSLFKII